MPRPFEVVMEDAVSVAEVHAAFKSETYWRARLYEFGGDSITLDTLNVDGDTIDVLTTQDMGRDMLPAVIAKAIPGGMRVTRLEHWEQRGETLHCTADISATGAPLTASGTAELTPTPNGSRLRFTGTLGVRLPLVGGVIERFIIGQLKTEIPAAQKYTVDWIRENG